MAINLNKKAGILTILGIDTSKPAEYILDQATPNCENIEIDRGVFRKRWGTLPKGHGTPMSEIIMRGVQFQRGNTIYNVRIGITKVNKWNGSAGTWDDITGSALTADATYPVSLCTPVDSSEQRLLIFTNNKDAIRKWDGTGNTVVLGGSPPLCKYVASYKGFLVLAHIIDGSVFPTRVQWSNVDDIEDWSGGNAGDFDLKEEGDEITGLAVFGDLLTVHKNNAIYVGYILTSGTDVFRFDRISAGIGTISNNTIQELPNSKGQIYLAHDGLRIFDGTLSRLLEGNVADEIKDEMNLSEIHRCWSMVVPELHEYWVAIPMKNSYPDIIYKYNYITGQIHKDNRTVPVHMTAVWRFRETSSLTWAIAKTLGCTWGSITGKWKDTQFKGNIDQIMFGDSLGYCYIRGNFKNDSYSVDYDPIEAIWETKDYQHEEIGRLCRWLEIQIWAKGDYLSVYYSIDEGRTWTLIESLTLSSYYPTDENPIVLHPDVVSSKIRFRFYDKTMDSMFYVKQFIIGYLPREMAR